MQHARSGELVKENRERMSRRKIQTGRLTCKLVCRNPTQSPSLLLVKTEKYTRTSSSSTSDWRRVHIAQPASHLDLRLERGCMSPTCFSISFILYNLLQASNFNQNETCFHFQQMCLCRNTTHTSRVESWSSSSSSSTSDFSYRQFFRLSSTAIQFAFSHNFFCRGTGTSRKIGTDLQIKL